MKRLFAWSGVAAVLFLAAPAAAAEQWYTARIRCTSPKSNNVENFKAKSYKDAQKKLEQILKTRVPYKTSSGCSVFELKAQKQR